jgi:hypothetical protein
MEEYLHGGTSGLDNIALDEERMRFEGGRTALREQSAIKVTNRE